MDVKQAKLLRNIPFLLVIVALFLLIPQARIILIIMVGFIIIGVLIYKYFNKKFQEYLFNVATKMGFEVSNKNIINIKKEIGEYKIYSSYGHSQSLMSLLRTSRRGNKWKILSYNYTTNHGKNSSQHPSTIFKITGQEVNMPKFLLTKENFLHKIGQTFGYKDFDYDEYPLFSKKYLLRGEDEAKVKKFMKKHVLFFESELCKYTIEGNGKNLLIYYNFAPGRGFMEKHFEKVEKIANKLLQE